ncbi:chromosome condensation protein CrcB [Halorubellus sp. JP-L1]|uniref:CrcB family protein n=1 Tax=Halorubellus sp. JP-L1 TaxID=2715753 RepID=UPI00140971DC|nr:CrcB family protein [Halorubellus sp. JP-L1]NHN40446.1 chromosome condensation protein CrcB [Halorubellus sp. JP-L1]
MTDGHPLASVETYALVALGGFAGANARYGVDVAVGGLSATLAVNVVGSALLGFLLYEEAYLGAFSGRMRTAVGTGFLSSLTTYSTFAVQTYQAAPLVAAGNVAGNYALGIGGVLLGRHVALALARSVEA